jgi:hypothetical protein
MVGKPGAMREANKTHDQREQQPAIAIHPIAIDHSGKPQGA